jgi:hypothetical protein
MNLVYSASTSSANINAKPWSNGAFVPASSRYLAGGLGLIRGIYNQNGETWILIETSSATQIAYPLTYPKLYPSVYTDDSWIINPQGSNSFFRSLLDIWTFSNSFTNTNYIEIVPYTTGNGPAVATTYPYISNELTQLITTVTTNAISIDSVVAPGTFSTSSVETSFGVQTAATWNLSASINDTAPLTNSNVLTYKIQ